MRDLKESPSQTAGPYVHIGCVPETAGLERRRMGAQLGAKMVPDDTKEASVSLDITVLDGDGAQLKDAMIEIWQAGPDGTFEPKEGFANWGRQVTDPDTGVAHFDTFKPAPTAGQSPHILVWIVARGINLGLTTRIYLPDEDNANDPVIAFASDRASTLVATKTNTGYSHVIRLQGPQETVFFDV